MSSPKHALMQIAKMTPEAFIARYEHIFVESTTGGDSALPDTPRRGPHPRLLPASLPSLELPGGIPPLRIRTPAQRPPSAHRSAATAATAAADEGAASTADLSGGGTSVPSPAPSPAPSPMPPSPPFGAVPAAPALSALWVDTNNGAGGAGEAGPCRVPPLALAGVSGGAGAGLDGASGHAAGEGRNVKACTVAAHVAESPAAAGIDAPK